MQGVAVRAAAIGDRIHDGALLVAAAWLHDLGYAPDLAICGFHPLDGARAVRDLGCSSRLSGLIAFHSAAVHEAAALGLVDELAEFTDEHGLLRDLLWYLDMTTSPDGDPTAFDERLADVRNRYPAGHYVLRALDASMADRIAAVARAEGWLIEAGLITQV